MESGVDLRLWITVAVVTVVFLVLPAVALEWERRKREGGLWRQVRRRELDPS